jgi:serine/threonine protein kinase/formylglycine-generating enzyme required for sulfatase activity
MTASLRAEIISLWQTQAGVPDLHSWLASVVGSHRPDQILEALQEDQRRRWRAPNPWPAETYLELVKQIPQQVDWRLEFVWGEYLSREHTDSPISWQELAGRYPELAEQLESRSSERPLFESAAPSTLAVSPESLEPDQHGSSSLSGPLTHPLRFQIVRSLGQGSFGEVQLAWDVELQRHVALKTPRSDGCRSETQAELFLAEARTVAGLRHPQIVSVHDVLRQTDGTIGLVVQYIEGENLRDFLQRGTPDLLTATTMIIGLARALDYAHQAGVIHRDVKPANILIEARTQVACLADFGLSFRSHNNVPQGAVGTPAYMSPEQATGSTELDGRSDLFSLGIVFYELLTGRRPFRGRSTAEVLQAVRTAAFETPRTGKPAIPEELEKICCRALAADPDTRYQSGGEFAAALEAWEESVRTQERRLRRRRWWTATAVAVILCLAFAGSAIRNTAWDRQVALLTNSVSNCPVTRLEPLIEDLRAFREKAIPVLKRRLSEDSVETPGRLSTAVALLHLAGFDPEVARTALEDSLSCSPEELLSVQALLQPWSERLSPIVGEFSQDTDRNDVQRFRAACLSASWVDQTTSSSAWTSVKQHRFVAEQFMATSHEELPGLLKTVKSRAAELLPQMAQLYRGDPEEPEQLRNLAEGIVTLGSQQTSLLCELILHAEPAEFEVFISVLRNSADPVAAFMQDVLRQPLGVVSSAHRTDAAPPPPELRERIQQQGGVLTSDFACSFDLTMGEFLELSDVLNSEAYRPLRLRSSSAAETGRSRYAAIWTRDGLVWKSRTGMVDQAAIDQANREATSIGMVLEDLTWSVDDGWSGLWRARKTETERRVHVTSCPMEQIPVMRKMLTDSGFPCQCSLQAQHQPGQSVLYYAVFSNDQQICGYSTGWNGRQRSDQTLLDVSIGRMQLPDFETVRAGYEMQFARLSPEADVATATTFERGNLLLKLGRPREAAAEFARVKGVLHNLKLFVASDLKALIRSGQDSQAAVEIEHLKSLYPNSVELACLQATAAAARGDEVTAGQRLTAASGASGTDAHCCWVSSQAAAECVRLLRTTDPATDTDALTDLAFDLLRRAIDCSSETLIQLQGDPEFEVLRSDLRFGELLDDARDRYGYVGLWSNDSEFETKILNSKDSSDLYPRIINEAEAGWQPSGIATGECNGESKFAVVLRRKREDQGHRAQMEQRKIAAAIVLLRLSCPDAVWPLIASDGSAGICSAILCRLSAYQVSPGLFTERLRLPSPAGFLALIQAVGEFARAGMLDSSATTHVRNQLLRLYANHPDPGIHSMCEWSLRMLGAANEMTAVILEYADGNPRGGRNWYVTRAGTQGDTVCPLTMMLLPGGEFDMGSPLGEPGREATEVMHRRLIPRRIAVSSSEVSRGLFNQFLRATDRLEQPGDAQLPAAGVTVFQAMEFCNWLSEQEGIEREHWGYVPENPLGIGMQLKGDYLHLQGYRLPSEAEFEYYTRAGETTARFFGNSDDLMSFYAWHSGNVSRPNPQPGGLLRPNSFGLFDVYGNVREWTGDRKLDYSILPVATSDSEQWHVAASPLRSPAELQRRGGSYLSQAEELRSASRSLQTGEGELVDMGFRVVRTISWASSD